MAIRWLPAVAVLVLATGAQAEVVESGASGFVIRHEIVVAAAPDKAYAALLDVASWWNPSHTYSGNAANLSLDARPGGCFCEKLPGGGGVEHMRVVMAMPDKVLRLAGGLGPLQAAALAGSLTWAVVPVPAGGSKVQFIYNVGGFMPGGVDKMAVPVDGVLGEQAARLKSLIDTGKPAPAAK